MNIPANYLFSATSLRKLIIPLIAEQFLAVFIGLADTLMVSSISEHAVSAISLVDSVNLLIIQLFSAMATGGAVVTAQYIGKQSFQQGNNAAKQLMYIVLALSCFLACVVIFARDAILSLIFGALEERTMNYARQYLVLTALSYPALALYNGGAALLRAMGNSKTSLYISCIMNLCNVGGNALLIYGFRMEVAGAAIATLVARMVGAVYVLILLCNCTHPIRIHKLFRPEPNPPMIGRILRQGIPSGLENCLFQVGKLMVTSLVATFSTAMIAANAVGNQIGSLTFLPGMAISLSVVTVVGQCIGAGEKEQAKFYAKKLTWLCYIGMGVINIIVYFFCDEMAYLFHLSPEAMTAMCDILQMYAITSTLLWAPSFCLPNALRASGDARFTMVVSAFSIWAFRIGASYLFVNTFHLGLMGVWLAMPVDWLVRACFFLWRFHSNKWLQKSAI